jgi:hypothetical protein
MISFFSVKSHSKVIRGNGVRIISILSAKPVCNGVRFPCLLASSVRVNVTASPPFAEPYPIACLKESVLGLFL